MKYGWLLTFNLLAVASVFANEVGHDSYETYDSSEESLHFEDFSCIEEGTCVPVDHAEDADSYPPHVPEGYDHPESSPHEHSVPDVHYTELCHRLSLRMQKLESLHPELGNLKFQLAKMLDHPDFGLNLECGEGESFVIKFLDFVISLAERLKEDYFNVPVEVSTSVPVEEIIAEEHDVPVQVGSVRGIPGEHYPNYSEVPLTSFSCSDKKYVPGFYADLETGCQVFHVCYEHRRESFLCPIGTVFNQPILACDYWYSSNCSLAPLYYDVNAIETKHVEVSKEVSNIGHLITTIIDGEKSKPVPEPEMIVPKEDLSNLMKFLPVKATVVEFEHPKPVVLPKPIVIPKVKPLLVVKPKLAAKAALKLPLAKAKFAAVPVVKAKVVKASVLPLKAKVAVPVVKAKVLPLVKTKAVAASVPLFKAKTTAKVIPFVKLTAAKTKVASVPVAKVALAKAAVISPLTTKALALGYMKLLKAKKIAFVG